MLKRKGLQLNWLELVWPVRGLLSPVSVRKQDLSVILKASVLLNIEIAKMKTEGSVHLLRNIRVSLHVSVFVF